MSNTNIFTVLKSAKNFYLNKEYKKASSLLLSHKKDMDQGLFHYNLGSIYLKAKDFGPARYHLEKAKKLDFSVSKTRHNIKVINNDSYTVDLSKSDSLNDILISKSMDVPSGIYSTASLFFILVTIVFLYKKIITRKLILISCLLLSLVPAIFNLFYLNSFNEAIIMKTTGVSEGPSEAYDSLYEINAGSKVIIGKISNTYAFIKGPIGYLGWIPLKNLGIIKKN